MGIEEYKRLGKEELDKEGSKNKLLHLTKIRENTESDDNDQEMGEVIRSRMQMTQPEFKGGGEHRLVDLDKFNYK